jgi:hypothetical protein
VKKALVILGVLALIFSLVACQSTKKGDPDKLGNADVSKVNRPEIVDYKGSEFQANPPKWITAYIDGGIPAVEKLPEFSGKYCIIFEMDAENKDSVMLMIANFRAANEIAGRISTRVQSRFAGAQVGDQKTLETYMESVVKVAREATVSGFFQDGEMWTQLQTFKPGAKKEPDKVIFRGYQLWTIDKDLLKQQIDKILDSTAANEPKTPEKQAAIDRVKEAFYEGF